MAEVSQGRAKLSEVIQIDERKIQEHLGSEVRSMVEETLNGMPDAEADRERSSASAGRGPEMTGNIPQSQGLEEP